MINFDIVSDICQRETRIESPARGDEIFDRSFVNFEYK